MTKEIEQAIDKLVEEREDFLDFDLGDPEPVPNAFGFHKVDDGEQWPSHLLVRIHNIPLDDMIQILGEPYRYVNHDSRKTDVEWHLYDPDNDIKLKIWNYKDGPNWRGGNILDLSMLKNWNIWVDPKHLTGQVVRQMFSGYFIHPEVHHRGIGMDYPPDPPDPPPLPGESLAKIAVSAERAARPRIGLTLIDAGIRWGHWRSEPNDPRYYLKVSEGDVSRVTQLLQGIGVDFEVIENKEIEQAIDRLVEEELS